jgi:O-antigen/teichoic acid export membrane protein
MLRQLFRDSLIYVIPSAVSTGMAFFLFPLYAHHFSPYQYGILEILTFSGTFIILVGALQMYQAVGRFATGEPDLALRRAYASTGLNFTLLWYGILGLSIVLFATPIAQILLGQGGAANLVRIAIAWTVVQGVLTFAQAQLRWEFRAVDFVIASVVNALFTALPAVIFVFYFHMGIQGALWGQFTGSTVALAYVAVVARRYFGYEFSILRLREMLTYSLPLVLSSVGVFLNLYADRLLIQHLKSVADVGVYGVGSRIATIVTFLLVGFQSAATPLFLARRDEPTTPTSIARFSRIFMLLGLATVVILSLFAVPLVRLVAASAYFQASSVVPLLVVSALFSGMFFLTPGLMIAKKTTLMAIITVLAGIANGVLCLLLIPPLGLMGAAIGTCLTSIAWFVALMVSSQRYYRVPHRWRSLVLSTSIVFLYVGFCLAILSDRPAEALSLQTLSLRFVLVLGGVGLAGCLLAGTVSAKTALTRLRPMMALLPQGRTTTEDSDD